jgi:hypothetical protein
VSRRALSIAPTLALLLATGSAAAGEAVSFKRDLVPVLRTQCATCHLTGQEAGNMKLHPGAAHASLVGVQSIESPLLRVKPGAPDDSYLMHKLEGTHLDAGGSGDRMPFGQPPLDEATRTRIRSWIAAGAENN